MQIEISAMLDQVQQNCNNATKKEHFTQRGMTCWFEGEREDVCTDPVQTTLAFKEN